MTFEGAESSLLNKEDVMDLIAEIEEPIRKAHPTGKYDRIVGLQGELTDLMQYDDFGGDITKRKDELTEKLNQGITTEKRRPPLEKMLHFYVDLASCDWNLEGNGEAYLNQYLDDLEEIFSRE